MLNLASFLCLLSTLWPVVRLRRYRRASALRSACNWLLLAAISWIAVHGLTLVQLEGGQPMWLGQLRLFSTALLLTPIVSVLGARWPGATAWNLMVVVSLVLVFAILMIEQGLLDRRRSDDLIGLDGPRLAFFGIIALMGVANYLPTRFGLAALLFCIGVGLQLAALGPWSETHRHSTVLFGLAGIVMGCSTWLAWFLRRKSQGEDFDARWLDFRDSWGLIWAMRVRERWNAAAKYHCWDFQLEWNGLKRRAGGEATDPETAAQAIAQLDLLLRRFIAPGSR
jgi:hypothetical protein